MPEYAWRHGMPKPKVDAAVFVETIERLGGFGVDPEVVVEEASRPDSPIHAMFVWDNRKAAKEYRIIQARQFITGVTSIRVTVESRDFAPRHYLLVKPDGANRSTYMPRPIVMSNGHLRKQVWEKMEHDLLIYVRRYQADLQQSSAAITAVEEAMAAIRDKIDEIGLTLNSSERRRGVDERRSGGAHPPPPPA